MSKNKKRYDGEFKLNCVKLVISSKGERTMKEIAQDLDLNHWVLADWKKKISRLCCSSSSSFRGRAL
jgi:transposase-like protein